VRVTYIRVVMHDIMCTVCSH